MLRKKRVTISEQAQAAAASGIPVDQALAEHGTPVLDAESTPPEITPPVIEPPVGGAPVSEEGANGDPVTGATSTDGEPAPAAVVAPAAVAEGVVIEADDNVSLMLDRLQAAQTTIATQAAEITGLKASTESLQTTQNGLLKVAVAATNRMQIALGGAATDLTGMTAENVLAQYESTLTTFEKRLPVGGKAEVPVSDGDNDGNVVPLVSQAAARATQIRK